MRRFYFRYSVEFPTPLSYLWSKRVYKEMRSSISFILTIIVALSTNVGVASSQPVTPPVIEVTGNVSVIDSDNHMLFSGLPNPMPVNDDNKLRLALPIRVASQARNTTRTSKAQKKFNRSDFLCVLAP